MRVPITQVHVETSRFCIVACDLLFVMHMVRNKSRRLMHGARPRADDCGHDEAPPIATETEKSTPGFIR